MKKWCFADATNKFTQLVNRALTLRSQIVRRGDNTAIAISKPEYEGLTGEKPSFKEYLLNPPHRMDDIDLERDRSTIKSVCLPSKPWGDDPSRRLYKLNRSIQTGFLYIM